MPQSLRARFNGTSEEVVTYTKQYGVFKAMDKYQVHDYLSMQKFLKEMTGEENVGIVPTIREDTHNLALELVEAFTAKVVKLENENVELKRKLAAEGLEYKAFREGTKQFNRASQVLEFLKV